jgi:hypothetical protein
MVRSITLKAVLDELLDELRKAAERDRRFLNQDILRLLSTVVRPRERPGIAPAMEAQIAAWRELDGAWEFDESPEAEARRLVHRRTRERKIGF